MANFIQATKRDWLKSVHLKPKRLMNPTEVVKNLHELRSAQS
jgi:hypothetical protein